MWVAGCLGSAVWVGSVLQLARKLCPKLLLLNIFEFSRADFSVERLNRGGFHARPEAWLVGGADVLVAGGELEAIVDCSAELIDGLREEWFQHLVLLQAPESSVQFRDMHEKLDFLWVLLYCFPIA